MGHHPVVGAHAALGYVPGSQQRFHGLDDLIASVLLQRPRQAVYLKNGGQEAEHNPAHHQGIGDSVHRLPRFGHVQHHAVNAALLDAVVYAAYLDFQVVRFRDDAADVSHSLGQHRFINFVGDDPALAAHGPEQRGGERPRSQPTLDDRRAGEYVCKADDVAQVFRVNDLGAARHLPHIVAQRGAHGQQRMPPVGAIPAADTAADDLVVVQPSQVAVKGLRFFQRHHVTAGLTVQQQGQLAGPEKIGVVFACFDCSLSRWERVRVRVYFG